MNIHTKRVSTSAAGIVRLQARTNGGPWETIRSLDFVANASVSETSREQAIYTLEGQREAWGRQSLFDGHRFRIV